MTLHALAIFNLVVLAFSAAGFTISNLINRQ